MAELNDALLWLIEHGGKISFSIDPYYRVKKLDPETPVVAVEALTVTTMEFDDGEDCEECFAFCEISAGRVAEALLTAINRARGNGDDDGDDEPDDSPAPSPAATENRGSVTPEAPI